MTAVSYVYTYIWRNLLTSLFYTLVNFQVLIRFCNVQYSNQHFTKKNSSSLTMPLCIKVFIEILFQRWDYPNVFKFHKKKTFPASASYAFFSFCYLPISLLKGFFTMNEKLIFFELLTKLFSGFLIYLFNSFEYFN